MSRPSLLIYQLHDIIGAVATRHLLRESNLPVAIYDINCTGSEDTIAECPHNALDVRNCHHREDASVVCQTIDGNINV